MSAILDVYDEVVGLLEDAGLPVVSDPRAARPPCIIVEPPTITGTPNGKTVTMDIPVMVCTMPPANRDAVRFLMGLGDQILDLVTWSTSAQPTVYTIGEQECPAYNITLHLTAFRS